jgi:hydrogenase 3 maturation protease
MDGSELRRALRGRVCVVGVGNRDRGDDAAGPRLVDLLRGRVGAPCLDAGACPENFLERMARERPDVVLVVDAADFGGAPGEARLVGPETVVNGGLSTHAASLELLAEYVHARTAAVVQVLAVQAASMRPGRPLSAPVAESVDLLAGQLAEILGAPAARGAPPRPRVEPRPDAPLA